MPRAPFEETIPGTASVSLTISPWITFSCALSTSARLPPLLPSQLCCVHAGQVLRQWLWSKGSGPLVGSDIWRHTGS